MTCIKSYARLVLAPFAVMALMGVAGATPSNSALSTPATAMAKAKMAIATFAGGCFWTMERAFDGVPGVITAVSGYAGGTVKNPGYEDVSSGSTGHAEAVQVTYDPTKISYTKLLDIYWHDIDPTQVDGQACDTGSQYRSAIFAQDATQMKQAQAFKDSLQKSGAFNKPIVVEINAASVFYPAAAEHQDFARTHAQHYEQYRLGCGRDRRLKAIWGASAPPSVPAI